MKATYSKHRIALHKSSISSTLQNELVQIFLAKVLDEYIELGAQGKWDERKYSTVRKNFMSALENNSGYNPDFLLKIPSS